MRILTEELKQLGDEVGQEMDGRPQGEELLNCYGKCSNLGSGTRFKVKTDQGLVALVSVWKLQEALLGIPTTVQDGGTISRKEAALALLDQENWQSVKTSDWLDWYRRI